MRKLALAAATCILLCGCSWRDVNEAMPFPVRWRDAAHEVAAKSVANTVILTVGGVFILAWAAAVLTAPGLLQAYGNAQSPGP